MIKRTGNKNLKIIAATAMTIFSLFSVFSATYAWFTANKKVNQTNDNFDVNPTSGMFYKMTIHQSVIVTSNTYQFDADPWGTITINDWKSRSVSKVFDEDSCLMGKYDYLEKTHPVLLLIQLGDNESSGFTATEDSPINVKAKSKTNYYVGDNAGGRVLYSTEDIDPANNHINPLSSVVSYMSTYFASDLALNAHYSEDSVVLGPTTYDTYDFNVSDFNNTSGSFTQFSGDIYTSFVSSPTVFSTDNLDYSETESYNVRTIAVVFDYYEKAMETIYSVFMGDPILNEVLVFNCDWTMEI